MASNFVVGNIGLYATYAEAVNDFPNGLNSFVKKFSQYTCDNSLQYKTSPYRDNSFELRNDKNVVEAKYVPEVSFTFFAMNEDVYSDFIQLTNTREFFVRYYDFELKLDVIRKMYMSEQSRDQIKIAPPDADNPLGFIQAIIGLKITFVSKLAYDSYADLIAKAHEDNRMLPRVETPDFDISSEQIVETYDSSGNAIDVYASINGNWKKIVVTDVGETITAYNSSGTAITVYRKNTLPNGTTTYTAFTPAYPTLSLTCDTTGATIKYTTDDNITSANVSTATWTTYSTPISLYSRLANGTETFTAMAQKSDMADSYLAKFKWAPSIGD